MGKKNKYKQNPDEKKGAEGQGPPNPQAAQPGPSSAQPKPVQQPAGSTPSFNAPPWQQGGPNQQQQQARGPAPQQQQRPPQQQQQQQRPPQQQGQQQRPPQQQQGQQQRPFQQQGQQQRPQQGGQQQPPRGPVQQGQDRPQAGGYGRDKPPQGRPQGGAGDGGRNQDYGRQGQDRPQQGGYGGRGGPPQQGQGRPQQQGGYGGGGGGASSQPPSSMANLALVPVPKNVVWQPGTRGTRIQVEVNYLKLALEKLVDKAYHYDATFDPDKPRKFMQPAIDAFQKKNFPKNGFAFDGRKNVYTSTLLPMKAQEFSDTVTIVCPDTDREKTYKITIKKVNEIDLTPLKTFVTQVIKETPQMALQCIDVVLRSAHNKPHIVQWKRSFFDATQRRDPLGRTNYELWYGLFQSAVLGWKPYLNIDIAHKAFPMATPIIKLLACDPNRYEPRDGENLRSELNGLNFIYTPPDAPTSRRMYRFYGIGEPAERKMFDLDGKQLSVAQYFKNKGCPLKYPRLPCLQTAGNAALPLEFCSIAPGQASNKKAPEECKRDMIKFAAIPSGQRKANILRITNATSYNSNSIIKEFGITVGTNFERIEARILPAPSLEYAGGKQITARSGVWRPDNLAFLSPKVINTWYVIVMCNRVRQSDVDSFVKNFQRQARSLNMQINDATDLNFTLNFRSSINEIQKVMERMKDAELIVCIIPDAGDAYARIKQCSELNLGILTQCIKSRTMGRMDQSCVGNILLKVNAKVNGVNHKIGASRNNQTIPQLLKTNNFMVIGADVTHPSPEQKTIPSLVGVAASSDIDAFQYNCCYRIQGPRVEMIEKFGDIVKEHLNIYRKKNGNKLPELILYYRDGVSDGQFEQLLDIEYKSMKKACSEIQQGYNPKITIAVVQKRHHTRFFPASAQHSDGKNANVIPGTVIDKEIVDIQKKQFFLVAHASIQGVAKPAKYQIIHDDSNFSADLLQELTYSLCHLFTRCNRTVSYVAPTYYAHLVAARARSYINEARLNMNKLYDEWQKRQILQRFADRNPMFFV